MRTPVEEFSSARDDVLKLIAEHEQVFGEFFRLAEIYNAKHALAKDSVKNHVPAGPVQLGLFKRDKASVSVKYDPTKLPDNVLLMPGVVTDVDPQILDVLHKTGVLTDAVVKDSRTVTTGTAKVGGPQLIVVKL